MEDGRTHNYMSYHALICWPLFVTNSSVCVLVTDHSVQVLPLTRLYFLRYLPKLSQPPNFCIYIILNGLAKDYVS